MSGRRALMTAGMLAVAVPAAAQDMRETCRIDRTCLLGGACAAADQTFGLDTTFGSGAMDSTYRILWQGQTLADVRHHDGHIFTWLFGKDEDQESFALAYIYNGTMPDPEVAEFSLTRTRIFGRLSQTLIHSGTCRERGT